MSFKMHCPHCSQSVSAEDEMIGQTFPCPNCGDDFTVTPLSAQEPRDGREQTSKPEKSGWRHNKALNIFAGAVLIAIVGAKLLGLFGRSKERTEPSERPVEPVEASQEGSGESQSGKEEVEQDPAIELGLERHGSTNFMDMRKGYGFEGKSYEMIDPNGGAVEGTYRDKKMVLVADWGLYEVSAKFTDGIALQQYRSIRGKLAAIPAEVILTAPGLLEKPIAERDQVSFVGIQVECVDLGIYVPKVRVLGLWNMTTNEFYNLENPASPPHGSENEGGDGNGD